MAIDIRATVTCSLGGDLISATVTDDYVQGTGLIKTRGTVELSGLLTPAIGTAVTFSYTKGGITTMVPRKLRVLSSFADPFRRTTKVELGCKLTYLQDLKEPVEWTAFDDNENNDYNPADAAIITLPIHAKSVMAKCLTELGLTASSSPLTNKFSIPRFDYSSGYVNILSDLLVSECYCGYLDTNEVLQIFSLDAEGGTGPVLGQSKIIDIAQIGVGQLPGEAVTVSYSTLKLKNPENTPKWDYVDAYSRYKFPVKYTAANGTSVTNTYNIVERSQTTTYFKNTEVIKKGIKSFARVVDTRVSVQETYAVTVLGNLAAEYLTNGIPLSNPKVYKYTTETYGYDTAGNEIFYQRYVTGSIAHIIGSTAVPFVFSAQDYVTVDLSQKVPIEAELRYTDIIGDRQQVRTYTYGQWSQTIQGQQTIAASRGVNAFTTSSQVESYLSSLYDVSTGLFGSSTSLGLSTGWKGLSLLDSRVYTERRTEAEIAPDGAALINAANADGGDPNNGYRTYNKSSLELALGSATAQRRIEFSMPYAPDDTFGGVSGGPYFASKSDAPQKAKRYGVTQNRLLLGNRSGMNIQAAPESIPSAPFAPFIVQANGLSALYRTNGTTYTMSNEGVLVGVDALYWGAVGGTGTFWFPVAPGVTTLPTTPPIVDGAMTVTSVAPVWNETLVTSCAVKIGLSLSGYGFSLNETTIIPPISIKVGTQPSDAFKRVSGTAAPVLGATQVTPTSTATSNGWSLLFNNTDDEGSTASGSFGFTFTLNNVAYTSCYITSNEYLTFGSDSVVYLSLSASTPSVPKLHIGSDDFSYQRIYTKSAAGLFRIRWEGNSAYDASAGSSNRFLEVTFYEPVSSGKQFVEIRTGAVSGSTSGPFMLATASTSLASGTMAANSSWVYEGDSTGTTWTLYANSHVE